MTRSLDDLLEPPPRAVKPRNRTYRRLPVVAIHGDDVLSETGEVSTTAELIDALPDYAPTLFAKLGAADFVGQLNSVYLLRDPNHWQWRASTHERDICRPDGVRVAARVSTAIHFFGFRRGEGGSGSSYHKIIDPVTMYGHRLDTIWPESASAIQDDDWQTLAKLLKWAVAVRDFCAENNIDVRPTTGGISAQLLTDRRFYPHARRKVPAKINERVREYLPGNHYMLNVQPTPSEHWRAYYLDQSRAHHYHARTTRLPNADLLYAHGSFRDLSVICFDDVWPDFHGLYCLDLQFPQGGYFRWLDEAESRKNRWFVFSNELQHLLDDGFVVNGVYAAWGSRQQDTGLQRYAKWCEEQLDRYDDAAWLKPLLLSAYGTLATRPKHAESIFRLASGGDPVTLLTGRRQLNGKRTRARQKLEPKIANVLHRGMIEAATRSESVGLSQWLDGQGFRVLSIYADAVIVECDDDRKLPLLPEPWRIKKELNHLQFINQQAFISDGMTKLPGVTRELSDYRQHRRPGYAPRVVGVEALTGKAVQTNRRI